MNYSVYYTRKLTKENILTNSASKRAKEIGCKSVADLSRRINKGREWMQIQFNKDPALFDLICYGAALTDLINKSKQDK